MDARPLVVNAKRGASSRQGIEDALLPEKVSQPKTGRRGMGREGINDMISA